MFTNLMKKIVEKPMPRPPKVASTEGFMEDCALCGLLLLLQREASNAVS